MESQQAVDARRQRFTDIFNQTLLNIRMLKQEASAGSSMLWGLHEFEGQIMLMLEEHGNK